MSLIESFYWLEIRGAGVRWGCKIYVQAGVKAKKKKKTQKGAFRLFFVLYAKAGEGRERVGDRGHLMFSKGFRWL